MKPRRYELGVPGAVAAVFAALAVVSMVTAGTGERFDWYVWMTFFWVVFAAPSVVAAWLLCHAWRKARSRSSTLDGPAVLLAAATATLPAGRRDWGAAMAAELTQVRGRSVRWWFAAGCARVAIFPPRTGRSPVLPVATLAVGLALVAGLAIGPALRVFAATFVGLVGAMVTLRVARARRLSAPASGPATSAIALAGTAAAIGLTAYVLGRQPSALAPGHSVLLAVAFAGSLGLALSPPRALTTSRVARRIGLGAALALAAGLLLVTRVPAEHHQGVAQYVMGAPIVVFFGAAALAAGRGRSLRAGLEATVWTAAVGLVLFFAVWVAEATRWYDAGLGLLLDAEEGHPLGVNVRDGIFWILMFIPVWALPFGVFGAALGSAQHQRREAPAPPPVPI